MWWCKVSINREILEKFFKELEKDGGIPIKLISKLKDAILREDNFTDDMFFDMLLSVLKNENEDIKSKNSCV